MILTYKGDPVSLLGNAKVYDDNGLMLFRVKRKFFTITRKTRIYDNQKNLLFVVRNKFWKLFFKSAFIYQNGKKIAKITRKISVKDNYTIQGFDKPMRIDGNIFGGHYKIIVDEKMIAEIRRSSTSFGFEFDVVDEEDAGMVVAIYQAIYNIVFRDIH